jgi:hypothetical protein
MAGRMIKIENIPMNFEPIMNALLKIVYTLQGAVNPSCFGEGMAMLYPMLKQS